jgi:phosphoenolpyruvate---glycerone phosphotransferase subunit DhaL
LSKAKGKNMIISAKDFKNILLDVSDTIGENVDYLTDLDAEIGDGDHGANMDKGFKKIKQQILASEIQDCGEMLIIAGKVLLNEIGGAMGPLYGGGLVKAGVALKGKSSLDKNNILTLFASMLESIKSLGGAKPGDKTMVDTIEPFVTEYRNAIAGLELPEAFEKALKSAENGMLSTKDIISRIGRSSRLMERSKGHIDVGAASSYLILESFYNSIIRLLK